MAAVTGGVAEFSLEGGTYNVVAATAPPNGRSSALLVTHPAFPKRFYGLRTSENEETADTHIDVTPSSGPDAAPSIVAGGVEEFIGNTGQQWFEKIHVFPDDTSENPNYDQGVKIDFGNILGEVDREYEIYNAYRCTSVNLNTLVISIGPGIETPEVAAGAETLGPQTSLLAAASTYNTGLTTGLGTPVRTKLRALEDGAPSFDGPVTFGFDLQTVELLAKGSRVSLVVAQPEKDVNFSMGFLTDIITAADGSEQRIALRKQPRERWTYKFLLDGASRIRFKNLFFDWQANFFGVPVWEDQVELLADTSVGATSFQISGGDDVDFRVGGLAVVISDELTADTLTLSAATDTLLTSSTNATYGHTAGDVVCPIRVCRVVGPIRSKIFRGTDLEEFTVTFEAVDNNTGAPTGSTTDWNSNTYDGKVLLDECNLVPGTTIRSEERRQIVVIDNQTGNVDQSTTWAKNKRATRKGFLMQNRLAFKNVKALLRALRGRQTSFWLPTKKNELIVTDSLTIGSALMDITNVGYVRFVQSREPKATFKITFTDGTSLIRVVQSAIDHPSDTTKERLTLDTTWPASRTVDEISKVEFYEQVRFDSDDFRFSMDRPGNVRMFAPVTTVFD